jgi:hypothetical protein
VSHFKNSGDGGSGKSSFGAPGVTLLTCDTLAVRVPAPLVAREAAAGVGAVELAAAAAAGRTATGVVPLPVEPTVVQAPLEV